MIDLNSKLSRHRSRIVDSTSPKARSTFLGDLGYYFVTSKITFGV